MDRRRGDKIKPSCSTKRIKEESGHARKNKVGRARDMARERVTTPLVRGQALEHMQNGI